MLINGGEKCVNELDGWQMVLLIGKCRGLGTEKFKPKPANEWKEKPAFNLGKRVQIQQAYQGHLRMVDA